MQILGSVLPLLVIMNVVSNILDYVSLFHCRGGVYLVLVTLSIYSIVSQEVSVGTNVW